MDFKQALDDGQAQARTFNGLFGGMGTAGKGIQQLLLLGLGNAGAIVGNDESHAAIGHDAGRHGHLAVVRRELHGIGEKVDGDLVQRAIVAQQLGQVGGRISRDGDVLFGGARHQHILGVVHAVADIGRLFRNIAAASFDAREIGECH